MKLAIRFIKLFCLCITPMLMSCGGDNEDVSTTSLHPDCEGINCGVARSAYTGTGIGVWTYANESAKPNDVPIRLSGLDGNRVTLVFSNAGGMAQPMQAGLHGNYWGPASTSTPPRSDASLPVPPTSPDSFDPEHRQWTLPYFQDKDLSASPEYRHDVPATLRAQRQIGEFRLKLWVTDASWSAALQPIVATLMEDAAGDKGSLRLLSDSIGGRFWGEYPATQDNAQFIAGDTRELNIVLGDYGSFGATFHDSKNERRKSFEPDSNEALMILIDVTSLDETAALDFARYTMESTIAHEFTHLVNVYHREVLMGEKNRFELWLEEMSAQHVIDYSRSKFPAISPVSNLNPDGMATWLHKSYQCPLNGNDAGGLEGGVNGPCSQSYYPSGASFTGFLMRQYGTGFYPALLATPGRGIDVVDGAIRRLGGKGFKDDFRRWGSMLALLPSNRLPAGFGFPARADRGFTFQALNGPDYEMARTLPKVLPTEIAPYSHLVLVDDAMSGFYRRDVQVPPGVAVTVYVQ